MCFNCVSRLTGGIILDKFRFKTFYASILVLSTALAFSYECISSNEYLFALYLGLTYFVSGAIFISMPIYYAQSFGPEIGSQAYAFFFTSNAFAGLAFSFIVGKYSVLLGYVGLLRLSGLDSFFALFILIILPSEPITYTKECLLLHDQEEGHIFNDGPLLHELSQDCQ